MKVHICKRCNQFFETKVSNKQFCSTECFTIHRKEYRARNLESRKVERCCRQCGKMYRRVYEKQGFCTIACGSRWNSDRGICDAWKKSQFGKRSGKEVPCDECKKPVYIVEHQFSQERHFCNMTCKGRFFSRVFTGSGNPMFGKSLSPESLAKQKATLEKNHPGITNAFFLADRRTKTRPQLCVYEFLRTTFPLHQFSIEKLEPDTKFYADIISIDRKLIVEFNGSYWHCDPRLYVSTYEHGVKRMTASEIWKADSERNAHLQQMGYCVLTVWELDFLSNAWKESLVNQVTEHGKNQSIDA